MRIMDRAEDVAGVAGAAIVELCCISYELGCKDSKYMRYQQQLTPKRGEIRQFGMSV
jgi:hypothetical protein